MGVSHSLRASAVSFKNIAELFEYKFCTSFVKFIHEYLKILCDDVSGVIFLISVLIVRH